jgi:hypothetical protein
MDIHVFRCSLVGQDTRLSPERPGFKSRQRNHFFNFSFLFPPLNRAGLAFGGKKTIYLFIYASAFHLPFFHVYLILRKMN